MPADSTGRAASMEYRRLGWMNSVLIFGGAAPGSPGTATKPPQRTLRPCAATRSIGHDALGFRLLGGRRISPGRRGARRGDRAPGRGAHDHKDRLEEELAGWEPSRGTVSGDVVRAFRGAGVRGRGGLARARARR